MVQPCGLSGVEYRTQGVLTVNERHGTLAHRTRPGLPFSYACWPQPAATRPCSQITLGRLSC